jgi:hypothetical protein
MTAYLYCMSAGRIWEDGWAGGIMKSFRAPA